MSLLDKILNRSPEVKEEPKPRRKGFFSTHEHDGLIKKESVRRAWENITSKLLAALPAPVIDGTMDSSEDGGISLKDTFANSQPNMSDALMMWYANQGFIGSQMCAILSQHWLISKACYIPARDAIRKGYELVTVSGDEIEPEMLAKIKSYDDAMRLDGNMVEFVFKGRIFGMRVAFFKVNSTDPDYYEKPFNIDGVTKGSYKGIVQVDPYWCTPMLDGESASDPSSIHFYEPTWWMINGKKYHRTHLVIFRNGEVPDILKPSYIFGGVPVPQQIMERVYAAERTANEAPMLAMSKRTTVYKTDLEGAMSNRDRFDANMQAFASNRDNYQVKIADREDDLQQFDTTLSDLDTVIMTQYQLVAAGANVPATELLGTSPKGFNATGEAETQNYNKHLESIHKHDLNPLILRHHQLVVKSYLDEDIDIRAKWNPLDSPTSLELAQTRTANAQADVAWFGTGAVDAYDLRNRLIMDETSGFNGMEEAQRPGGEPDLTPPDDGGGKPDNEAQDSFGMDADKWITVHPNGGDSTRQPALIGEDGTVKAGMGGKFNGMNIKDAHGTKEFTSHETNAETAARNSPKKYTTESFLNATKHGNEKDKSFILVKKGTGEAVSSPIDNTPRNIETLNKKGLNHEKYEAISESEQMHRMAEEIKNGSTAYNTQPTRTKEPAQAELDKIKANREASAQPQRAQSSANSEDAPVAQATKRLDHGELNIKGRTNKINAELDKYKAEQARQSKSASKSKAEENRQNKATAKELLEKYGNEIINKHGDKLGHKQVRDLLNDWSKHEPKKLINFVEKHKKEQGISTEQAKAGHEIDNG